MCSPIKGGWINCIQVLNAVRKHGGAMSIIVPRDREGRSRRNGSASEAVANQASTNQPQNPKVCKHHGAYRPPKFVAPADVSGERVTRAQLVQKGLERLFGAAEFSERGT